MVIVLLFEVRNLFRALVSAVNDSGFSNIFKPKLKVNLECIKVSL